MPKPSGGIQRPVDFAASKAPAPSISPVYAGAAASVETETASMRPTRPEISLAPTITAPASSPAPVPQPVAEAPIVAPVAMPIAQPIVAPIPVAPTPILVIGEPSDVSRTDPSGPPRIIQTAEENLKDAMRLKEKEEVASEKKSPSSIPPPPSLIETSRGHDAETLTAPAPPTAPSEAPPVMGLRGGDRERKNSPPPTTTTSSRVAPRAPAHFDSAPPEEIPSRAEVDAGRKRKEERPSTTSVAMKVPQNKWPLWGTFLIGGSVLFVAVLVLVFATQKTDLTENTKESASSTATSAAAPSSTPPSPTATDMTPSEPAPVTVFIPKDGLPMTPENLKKVFGQSDPKHYRKRTDWKEGDPFFCKCTLPDQPIVDVSSCWICQ